MGDVLIEVLNASPPYCISPKDPFVQTVSDNAQAVFNQPPSLRYIHATGDNRIFRMFGVPTVDYGCPGYSGIPDEFIWVESLIGVTKVHAATAIDVLGLR
ncbi:MAG: hypothetical protein HYY85_02690 [Deltaproteobacteria bacterium]|nr:hypothetical protein [Deltaproteobacteria bacterium]